MASRPHAGVVAAVACGGLGLCVVEVLRLRRLLGKERRLRAEERRGRTKAEISLRNVRKSAAAQGCGGGGGDAGGPPARPGAGGRVVRPIGYVSSPFVKRAGTPRQGAVCPSGRGTLRLDGSGHACVSGVALEGLEDYSHAWLIFEFHGNTNDGAVRAAKVAPPRGYGAKVGWLATRSPHRATPMGLSLVKIDAVDARRGLVRLSALDLCDGTPVWDLKPYVPWDAPQHPADLRVPDWVAQRDELANVTWSPAAAAALERSAPFLAKHGYDDRADHAALDAARRTIDEVLRQDPRNKRQRNDRKAAAKQTFKIHFAAVEVEFNVDDNLDVTVLDVLPAPDDDDKLRTTTGLADAPAGS